MKIRDVSIPKMSPFGWIKKCAEFHACIAKCTIVTHIYCTITRLYRRDNNRKVVRLVGTMQAPVCRDCPSEIGTVGNYVTMIAEVFSTTSCMDLIANYIHIDHDHSSSA